MNRQGKYSIEENKISKDLTQINYINFFFKYWPLISTLYYSNIYCWTLYICLGLCLCLFIFIEGDCLFSIIFWVRDHLQFSVDFRGDKS